MHPDQFVILNYPNAKTVMNSINELTYHCSILDAMCLDETAKVQTCRRNKQIFCSIDSG
jgi:UV DNA damage repair endonuclease